MDTLPDGLNCCRDWHMIRYNLCLERRVPMRETTLQVQVPAELVDMSDTELAEEFDAVQALKIDPGS
jgi:hypothetical protein